MNNLVSIVSTPSLEKWDWRNPEKGIGGSETSHVRMAQGLFKRGYEIRSYAPIPAVVTNGGGDPTGLPWATSEGFEYHKDYKVLINYRDPKLFDAPKPEGAKWWFVAQDVDYPWTQEQLAKVDRYITLCPVHAAYTKTKYPDLDSSGRLYISSNGISSAQIAEITRDVPRNPKRLMYASSPDRGLLFILENWFRIRERVPEAEFHVFYGFHNMEVIVAHNGETDWRFDYQRRLQALLQQPGVVWHDRVGQVELWQEWAKSNIWFYPTEFPETSCITSMEAQACGAIPVTTNLWALKQNVDFGYKFDGNPNQSPVIKSLMIDKVVELLNTDSGPWDVQVEPTDRERMMSETRKKFDWERVVDQWEVWLEEDIGILPRLKMKLPTEIEARKTLPLSVTSACISLPIKDGWYSGAGLGPYPYGSAL